MAEFRARPEQLRLASTIGIDAAERLKAFTEEAVRARQAVTWSGWPRYPELLAVTKIVCGIQPPSRFGARSAQQLAFYLVKLRGSASILDFFRWHSRTYQGTAINKDNVFRFLRACEYGLPQLFALVELFAKRLVDDIDYSLFVGELPRWFRPEVLKNLDEQGVPIQISERFHVGGDTMQSLSERLVLAAATDVTSLSSFERRWINDAMPTGSPRGTGTLV
jgi:hypothetical protein